MGYVLHDTVECARKEYLVFLGNLAYTSDELGIIRYTS